jgi:signal transduction histidine kinase
VGHSITTAVLVAIGAGVRAGLFHPDPGRYFDWSRMATWVRISAIYLLGTALTASTVATLLARLERSLAGEQQARAAAERAVGVREEFLTLAAHELRTPITSLRLSLQVLSRRARQNGGEEFSSMTTSMTRMLDIAERQTIRLERLMATLLDVTNIGSSSLPVSLGDVDLADAVRTSVAQLSDDLRSSGSSLTLDMGEPVVGWWDRVRLEEVVVNLLSNAIKYGEGRPIEVGVHAEPEVAHLVVSDHGRGIAPEDRMRIFGRFERATPASNYGGLGLGLYVVQLIVERLGGTVDCVSDLHAGSSFIVNLPRGGRSEHAGLTM